jgi:hypothetical protein
LWTILGLGKLKKVYTRLGSGGPHPHFVIKNPARGLRDPKFDSGPSHSAREYLTFSFNFAKDDLRHKLKVEKAHIRLGSGGPHLHSVSA